MKKSNRINNLSCAKELKDFHAKAKKLITEIAAKRDELRSLIADYEDILERTDDAHEQFESALDTLSELI